MEEPVMMELLTQNGKALALAALVTTGCLVARVMITWMAAPVKICFGARLEMMYWTGGKVTIL